MTDEKSVVLNCLFHLNGFSSVTFNSARFQNVNIVNHIINFNLDRPVDPATAVDAKPLDFVALVANLLLLLVSNYEFVLTHPGHVSPRKTFARSSGM